jgi:hypothetical protein
MRDFEAGFNSFQQDQNSMHVVGSATILRCNMKAVRLAEEEVKLTPTRLLQIEIPGCKTERGELILIQATDRIDARLLRGQTDFGLINTP